MIPIAAGQVIGPARLDQFIGEGAMGVVYRGHHLSLGIDVAVKVLKPEVYSGDPRYRERFQREARLAARLNHPGIVRVLDFGEHAGGSTYLVMEFVDGYTLEEYLRRHQGPVPEQTGLRILAAVAAALGAAHDEGIVHRDLKPANLLINRKGQLKVADLGLAREDGSAALTKEHTAPGTPAYMAPECFQPDQPTDQRVDLYALGIIGYQLAYGRQPYSGPVTQIINGHLGGQADWSRPTAYSRRTVAIIRKLMAVDPSARYAIANAAQIELRTEMGTIPATSRAKIGAGDSSSSIAKIFEGGLSATLSERDGRTIVHTTRSERLLVWLILAAVIVIATIGFLSYSHTGRATPPAAPVTSPPIEARATPPLAAPAAPAPLPKTAAPAPSVPAPTSSAPALTADITPTEWLAPAPPPLRLIPADRVPADPADPTPPAAVAPAVAPAPEPAVVKPAPTRPAFND